MSFNGQIVVDMDSHIREYEDVDRTYGEYIDPDYHEAFQRLSDAVADRRAKGLPTALFMHPMAIVEPADESRPMGVYDTFGQVPQRTTVRTKAESRISQGREPVPREVHWDPSIRLRDMDRAQIDVSIMFPSHAASFCALRDVGFETALHQAYHRFCANYSSEAEGRLRWAFTATMRDVEKSVTELTYWAEHDANCIGLLLSPACPDGRLLDNPDLHPLYQRAQDLDLPVLIHGGVLRPPYTAGATELDGAGYLLRAYYQPWAGMTALGALLGGGIFDKFPQLRAGIFETTAGWMPWAIEQLEEGFSPTSTRTPYMERPPSEVIAAGQIFHAVESGEKHLDHCVESLGDDIWLFATDYPHSGSPWPDGVPHITERKELTDSTKAKILGQNALKLCTRLAE
jgi:uncharacterized protein